MDTIKLLLTLLVIGLTGYGIYKKYNVNIVLLFAGLALNLIAVLWGFDHLMPRGTKGTGFIGFDLFAQLRALSTNQVATTGFIILVAGGFAAYMDAMGASDKLVILCLKPLKKLSKPYLLLGLVFLLANFLGLVVTSAAGLAMLLIVSIYPILIGLGVSPLSAAAVIASALIYSYAPSSAIAVLAAQTAGTDPMTYLVNYQLPVALPGLFAAFILHIILQKYFDKRDATAGKNIAIDLSELQEKQKKAATVPGFYALLPLVPLILLFIFNKMVYKTVVLDVASAMFIGWVFALLVDWIYRRNTAAVFKDGFAMFKGMGNMMTNVVGLIFVASLFAAGLQSTGLVALMIDSAKHLGLGMGGTGIVMAGLIGLVTVLTGSGVASFTSLVPLAPVIAQGFGGDAADISLMLQIGSEALRPVSPVAGVVIICAGFAKASPVALVKRTAIPCLAAAAISLSLAAMYLH